MALFQNNAEVEADEIKDDFALIDEGVYDAVVYEAETGEFKSEKHLGMPRVIATLKITGPEFVGRQLRDFAIPLFVEDGYDWANRKAKEFFVTGLGYESFEEVAEELADIEDLLGKPIKIVVGTEPDNRDPDTLRNVIKRYVAADYEPRQVKAPAAVKKAKKKAAPGKL